MYSQSNTNKEGVLIPYRPNGRTGQKYTRKERCSLGSQQNQFIGAALSWVDHRACWFLSVWWLTRGLFLPPFTELGKGLIPSSTAWEDQPSIWLNEYYIKVGWISRPNSLFKKRWLWNVFRSHRSIEWVGMFQQVLERKRCLLQSTQYR